MDVPYLYVTLTVSDQGKRCGVSKMSSQLGVTFLDTSHSSLRPCGPLEHASTALFSSFLDCGENSRVAVQTAFDIDPGDSANMALFLAFEWTQADPHSFRFNDLA